MGFIATQGDRIILGGLFTAEFLGIYGIAFMLSGLASQLVSTFSHKILFPKFSAVNRDTPNELKKILTKSRFWLNLLVFPTIGIAIALSMTLVGILYDERYIDAGWILEILFIRVAIGCILIPSSICLMAIGMPKYTTISAIINAVFVIVFLPLSFQYYDTYGVIISIGFSGLLSIPALWYGLIRHKLFNFKNEVTAILLLFIGYYVGTYINDFF